MALANHCGTAKVLQLIEGGRCDGGRRGNVALHIVGMRIWTATNATSCSTQFGGPPVCERPDAPRERFEETKLQPCSCEALRNGAGPPVTDGNCTPSKAPLACFEYSSSGCASSCPTRNTSLAIAIPRASWSAQLPA